MKGLWWEIGGDEELTELAAKLKTGRVAELSGKPSAVKNLQKTFDCLTSEVYVVRSGKTERLASKAEQLSPSEYLFANRVLHVDEAVYTRLAAVMWCLTLFNRYARVAGIAVVFSKEKGSASKLRGNYTAAARANLKKLLDAIDWYNAEDIQPELDKACALSAARLSAAVYPDDALDAPTPYIDWESAASGVMGLGMSNESASASWFITHGYEMSPADKASFIRDYIKAEKKLRNAVSRQASADVEKICVEIEKLADLYAHLDNEKLRSVITTVSRGNYTLCTERQMKFLTKALDELQEYHIGKLSKGLLGPLNLDADWSGVACGGNGGLFG